MKSNQKQAPPQRHIKNEQIGFHKVMVVDQDNQQIGIMERTAMLEYAQAQGLDAVLITISPKPIVKIMNYGKYKYQLKKNLKEQKQQTIIHQSHQINFSVMIGEHDLMIKINKCYQFLLNLDPVKIQIRQRGREISQPQLAQRVIDTIYQKTIDLCADFRNQIRHKGRLIEWTLQPLKQKVIQWKEQNGINK